MTTDPDQVTYEQLIDAMGILGIDADNIIHLEVNYDKGVVSTTRLRRDAADTKVLTYRNGAATVTTDIPMVRN